MAQALSERTIALVKATVPALEALSMDIVHEMYSRMFQDPEIRDLFNQSHHGPTYRRKAENVRTSVFGGP